MNISQSGAILRRRDGHVLHATFNRPEALNALDDTLQDAFEQLIDDVAHDDETRVLVLTGAGRAFSAGGDIEEMQRCIEEPDLFRIGIERGKRHILSILDCPKPIIAKVNGAAIGLGATLALFCDIVTATRTAKIADPHVSIGLSAGDGGALIWPALIGHARAKALLFTGDAITGEEAERLGLILRALPPEELDGVTDALAQRIANGAAIAVQNTKRSANLALRQLVEAALDQTFAWEIESQASQDHRIAVAAFRNKVAPAFTGR